MFARPDIFMILGLGFAAFAFLFWWPFVSALRARGKNVSGSPIAFLAITFVLGSITTIIAAGAWIKGLSMLP